MSARKIRRAAAHAARKLARKNGFPTPTSVPPVVGETTLNESANEPQTPQRPISQAQLDANRANAQHSSGPKTEAGRAASSQNHTMHGLARHNGVFKIFPTEDAAKFEALKAGLVAEHKPVTVTEGILVNLMAESHWLAERAQRLADCCTETDTGLVDQPVPFHLYQRYQTSHRRAFHKALNDLLKLRKETRKTENGFEAQKQQSFAQQLKEQIEKEEAAFQDPEFKADTIRLGMASLNKGPEYDRLKAEFRAKYWPKWAQEEAEANQAAA